MDLIPILFHNNNIKTNIIPYIEKNYRAKSDPQSWALAGLSIGGIQTLYAGVNNTDLFAYLGVFRSGWITSRQTEIKDAQYAFMKNNADKINVDLATF